MAEPNQCGGDGFSGQGDGVGDEGVIDEIRIRCAGRISASEQKTPASAANADRYTYGYYANDGLASEGYPSGGW
jgi:hypothetical protein